VYNDISGGDKHWFWCAGCFSFLHFQSKYNVVVSGVPKNSVGNSALISKNDATVTSWSNQRSDAHTLVNNISKLGCYYGIHVVERYVNEWTASNYGSSRSKQYVGSGHTIIVWAINNACPL
jgi:hypothetical protein